MSRKATAALLAVLMTGCYHATIETGLKPSEETITQPWALSFVYGLVPPPTVATMQKCSRGVAKVETQLSFLNQVVSGLTFGLFTPMTIKVTCAGSGTASNATVPAGTDPVAAVAKAADLAATTHQPVLVQF